MTPRLLALPDAWRLKLVLDPGLGARVQAQLGGLTPKLALVDWEGPPVGRGETLFVAALDLSTAELLVKLPSGSRVFVVDHWAVAWRSLVGSQRRFLERARALPFSWVEAPFAAREALEDLPRWLAPAFVREEEAR